jgi:crossover junction endodeoxyribonuclease RuvC
MTRIGIDPGITGAIAVLDDDPRVYDMPTASKLSGKGQQVEAHTLAAIIRAVMRLPGETFFASDAANESKWRENCVAYLEHVGPMPKQGVTSVWSFGRSAGVVEGVLAALGVPTVLVRPQAWKRRAGILRADKDASRTLAMQIWPGLADQLGRKRDVGRAEALLIARFGADYGRPTSC